jgi:hypothetical protein
MRCIAVVLLLPLWMAAADPDADLLAAAAKGQTSQVEALLGKGANVEARDKNDRTPLMLAAQHGHSETVRLLLAHGAKPDSRDKDGFTAYGLALFSPAGKGAGEALKLLPQPPRPRVAIDALWLRDNIYSSCFLRPDQLPQFVATVKPDVLVTMAFRDFLVSSGKGLIDIVRAQNHGMAKAATMEVPDGADALLSLAVRPDIACVQQQSSDSLNMLIDVAVVHAPDGAVLLKKTFGGGLKGLRSQGATSAVQYPALYESRAKTEVPKIYWAVAEVLLK